MKALKNHIILYDADCPMCTLYTKAFTKTGMLDVNGRAPYQEMATCPYVDMRRAVNEIALVNTETGEVNYGIKSLFKVIGNSAPVFKPLFAFAPFVWLMSKVYAFISYNRRVIIPADTMEHDLQPTFKLRYRVAYLLFTWLVVGLVLTQYADLLTPFVPLGNHYREYAICGGQIIFQGIIVSFLAPVKRWNYLGNMMTISLVGALALVPIEVVSDLVHLWPIVYPAYFMLVAGLMLLEHIRRSKLLHIGWLMSITWVVYRIIILAIILNLVP
jgi:hypothetical protein